MRFKKSVLGLVLSITVGVCMWQSLGSKAATVAPSAEEYLISGKLSDGERALSSYLARGTKDDQARFGLGMLQFIRAIERLSQDLYKYGIRDASQVGFGPLSQMSIKQNPNPEMVTYEKMRGIAQTLYDGLYKANETMAPITDTEVKLPMHFGLIKLDLDGDHDRMREA